MEQPAFRAFFTALARHRTVVRYDRPGVGLSSRERHDFTQATEVEVLDAIVARLGTASIDLLAFSCAAPVALTWVAANPGRVEKLVLVGAYSRGADLASADIRNALVALVDAHWGMGAEAINRLFCPDLSSRDARALGRDQLASTSAETAARLLGLSFSLDADDAVARVGCSALVIHRKRDHTVCFDAGRDLASKLPDAVFLPVPGAAHLPWLGDASTILSAILAFLDDGMAAEAPAAPPSWKRSGDVWTLCFGGRTVHVKHVKGLADLGVLLGRPGRPFEALELYAGLDAPRPPPAEPVIDRQALAAYRSRLGDLTAELDHAEQRGDLARCQRLQAEQKALLVELGKVTGLGGRVRTGPSPAERARKAVSARIRDAITKIGGHHPDLAAHLGAAVSMGATCMYQPRQPVAWST